MKTLMEHVIRHFFQTNSTKLSTENVHNEKILSRESVRRVS